MQQAIIRYIQSRIPRDVNKAQYGIVINNGKRVTTTSGRTYNLAPVTDVFYSDGDGVVCLIPDSGRTAACVGRI